jgi:hypothetical protein
MEEATTYTSLFEPILFFLLSLSLGLLIGSIAMLHSNAKELKATREELDKFRKMYLEKLDKWKNKYTDDNPNDRFSARAGALHNDRINERQ